MLVPSRLKTRTIKHIMFMRKLSGHDLPHDVINIINTLIVQCSITNYMRPRPIQINFEQTLNTKHPGCSGFTAMVINVFKNNRKLIIHSQQLIDEYMWFEFQQTDPPFIYSMSAHKLREHVYYKVYLGRTHLFSHDQLAFFIDIILNLQVKLVQHTQKAIIIYI